MLKELVPTETISSSENTCGGCGTQIRDRFYLLTADRAWHGQCLRCCRCSQPLDTELSCFAREGNIYCKEDYFRLFSSRRCARCGTGLSSSELVMRARELVFHVGCFSCILCGIQLSSGDTAGIRNGRVFCGEHFDTDILSEASTVTSHFFPGSPQKGRPRKRKQTQQQQQLQLQQQQQQQQQIQQQQQQQQQQLTSLSESETMNRGGTPMRMELLHTTDLPTNSLDLSSYDGSQSPSSGGSLTPQTRTKRMRTSFKHHQLRTMKSYFAINQNPDAKDLKQLAQKTGLSKRVLQVWFQNARAKWRRNVMRQDVQGPNQPNLQSLTQSGPSSVQSSNSNMEVGMTHESHSLDEMHHMTFAELY